MNLIIRKLEECSEELMKTNHLYESNILLAVIGILKREEQRGRIENIETGILHDLEKYWETKVKEKFKEGTEVGSSTGLENPSN